MWYKNCVLNGQLKVAAHGAVRWLSVNLSSSVNLNHLKSILRCHTDNKIREIDC